MLYDNCTEKYLKQAGMKIEWMQLADKGIHGNGHMVMIEKNNLQIAKVIDDWVVKNVISDRCDLRQHDRAPVPQPRLSSSVDQSAR